MGNTQVRAELWQITAYESFGDFIHGMGHIVTELYIPSEKVAFNYDNKRVNCITNIDGLVRYKGGKLLKEITISSKDYELLLERFRIQKILDSKQDLLKQAIQKIIGIIPDSSDEES